MGKVEASLLESTKGSSSRGSTSTTTCLILSAWRMVGFESWNVAIIDIVIAECGGMVVVATRLLRDIPKKYNCSGTVEADIILA